MKKILLIHLLLFILITTKAQSVAESKVKFTLDPIALVDIEYSTPTNLTFLSPTEAGLPLVVPNLNNTNWINYTSAITRNGVKRRITASLNELIPGVTIKLIAGPAALYGAGNKGLSTGQQTLNTFAQTIINEIGGTYTGNGTNRGHQLSITAEIDRYENLTRINKIIVVTYTILE